MGSISGLLVLFLATLTLVGCAGLNGLGFGYGDGMNGSGGAYDAAATDPAALDPAYAAAATAGSCLPQTQPCYTSQPYVDSYNGAAANTPEPPSGVAGAPLSPPGDPSASPWIDQREREQADHIRQGLLDGSLTPQEARRLWAEQGRIRAIQAQMRAYGHLSPQERARFTARRNRPSRAFYRARYNGMVRPGMLTPPPGHGPLGLMAQPGTSGASTPVQVQPQAPGYGQGSQLLPNQRFRRISTAPSE